MINVLLFVLGLVALVVGASLLVRGASRLALSFGISPLVVGLTVVAFGTSAPEVAVSVGAALKGQTDIAIGNVVGSNIFNVLFILGASALIAPLLVNVQLIRQEVPSMISASLLLLLLGIDGRVGLWDAAALLALLIAYTVFRVVQSRRSKQAGKEAASTDVPIWVMLAAAFSCLPVFLSGREIARWEGLVFLGYYAAYVGYLILAAQRHAALAPFSTAMMSFVIPLTVVTLIAVMIRRSPQSQ
jgi:Ca2+/Na+ antiporter